MPAIIIEGLIPDDLPPYANHQAYNVLDSAITAQLLPVLEPMLDADTTARIYDREMRLQALCLEMDTKGFPTDMFAVANIDIRLKREADRALHILHACCEAIYFPPVNPRSPNQVADLFYSPAGLGLPTIYKFDRKLNQRKVSTDIKALEKLETDYPIARPFVNAINAVRSANKMRSVFNKGLEPITNNLRCDFNPAGTETGRMSSKGNPFGRGTNGQNITDELRQTIVAPDGYCILNADLKTAESLAVGYIAQSRAYIEACESGDLHTQVCQMNWKDLPWTDDLRTNKKLAEQPYYRHWSYRDMAKRGGHGSNYYGTPPTMASHLKLPTHVVAEFQDKYFSAFPEIPEWHLRVIAQIQQSSIITNALGRKRRFWGRTSDSAVWREAIAFDPQSLVADVMNEGLLAAAHFFKQNDIRAYVRSNGRVYPAQAFDLRAQVHDAGVFIVPIDGLAQIAELLLEHLAYPVDFGPLGVMQIPFDLTVGKSWNKLPKNPAKLNRYTALGQRDYAIGDNVDWLKQ